MAAQLELYNRALYHCGERSLASLSENQERRRALDDNWQSAVNYCLEQGLWIFARRSVSIDPSSTLIPAFGFIFAFDIPPDWIRTIQVSGDPEFIIPLNNMREETGAWFANTQPIYVGYISSDPTYGWNLGAWPRTFAEYVGIRLAVQASGRILQENKRAEPIFARLEKAEKKYRIDARSKDAMNEAIGQRPIGTWVRSRRWGLPFGGLFGPGSAASGPTGDDG